MEDLQIAQSLGADAIGFVLWNKSKRAITLQQVKELVCGLDGSLKVVCLFVNPTREEVEEALKILPEAILQFHGDETAQFCHSFGSPWIKAVSISSAEDLSEAQKKYSLANYILCDTPTKGYGGSGRSFDWELLATAKTSNVILAGGLTPDNVKEAITKIRPFAVDVSSGVESSPGVKCSSKMSRFIAAVRAADNCLKSNLFGEG